MTPDQQARVLSIAQTWLRTPYHDMGRIRGVGCDCATLLVEVYQEAQLIPPTEIEPYAPQWHLNRGQERYLDRVLQFADEVETPEPADVVLYQFGRLYSHGGIVVRWPLIIHARVGQNVQYENSDQCAWLSKRGEGHELPPPPRPRKFFRIKA